MATCYILYSEKLDRYYIGATDNFPQRLEQHNAATQKATKGGVPWRLAYREEFDTKSEAMARERAIKNKKSRKYIEWLIAKTG